jgi:hypothetical protein
MLSRGAVALGVVLDVGRDPAIQFRAPEASGATQLEGGDVAVLGQAVHRTLACLQILGNFVEGKNFAAWGCHVDLFIRAAMALAKIAKFSHKKHGLPLHIWLRGIHLAVLKNWLMAIFSRRWFQGGQTQPAERQAHQTANLEQRRIAHKRLEECQGHAATPWQDRRPAAFDFRPSRQQASSGKSTRLKPLAPCR